MWSSHGQLTIDLNLRISEGIADMKIMTPLGAGAEFNFFYPPAAGRGRS
jgi:hypothetical protein